MRNTTTLIAERCATLTNQPWHHRITETLLPPFNTARGLVGVDIGHVKIRGRTLSEVCAAFVMRDDRISATGSLFTNEEGFSVAQISNAMSRSRAAAQTTHSALAGTYPQINTAIFRSFTLAYFYDFPDQNGPCVTDHKPRLIVHDARTKIDPAVLAREIQSCLDAVTAENEHMVISRLAAPAVEDLSKFVSGRKEAL